MLILYIRYNLPSSYIWYSSLVAEIIVGDLIWWGGREVESVVEDTLGAIIWFDGGIVKHSAGLMELLDLESYESSWRVFGKAGYQSWLLWILHNHYMMRPGIKAISILNSGWYSIVVLASSWWIAMPALWRAMIWHDGVVRLVRVVGSLIIRITADMNLRVVSLYQIKPSLLFHLTCAWRDSDGWWFLLMELMEW